MKLSNEIYRASKKYRIPARIYTAILMQESRYRLNAIREVKGHSKLTPTEEKEALNNCIYQKYVKYSVCAEKVFEARKIVKVVTDYGIAQIYYETADSYKFDTELLLSDLQYSVDSGAKVLSYFHKRYSKKESDWWVRYNIGTRQKSRVKSAWNEYKLLVSRYL